MNHKDSGRDSDQRQKAETRGLFLDAARALFEERGFDGTTRRRLAEKAEVGLYALGALILTVLYRIAVSVKQESASSAAVGSTHDSAIPAARPMP